MPLYELDGHKVVTPGEGRYWVAPNASVIGRVELGAEVSIWFGAVVRADNEPIRIGARTSIQDNCVLHVDLGFAMLIGEDCTIGHLAMLHGCTIGNSVLIGIGAIVLNGARIGDGSIIGAGALVTEGREVAPGSVVLGAPGKVVRQVADADRALIQEGTDFYVANQRRFAAGMKLQAG